MANNNLVEQCESFRKNVMLSIDSLEISEAQKQLFLLNFQGFYLQMLQQMFRDNSLIEAAGTLAEIVN
jgi:hypothetical protein